MLNIPLPTHPTTLPEWLAHAERLHPVTIDMGLERVRSVLRVLRDGVLVYQGGLDELKESVVRVTLMSDHPFTQKITWPNLIKQKNSGNQAQLVLEHWLPDMERQLAQDFSAQVRVEYLSLEDIFLEMNP